MPEAAQREAPQLLVREALTMEQFARVASFIQEATGIRMPPGKREMVQARLGRRMRALGIGDFESYLTHTFDSPTGFAERARLIDAVTTNKTDFFREPDHFDFLTGTALPALMAAEPDVGVLRPVVVWSAGCSTGEEPYSIAISLAEYERTHGPMQRVVYGTDICGEALEQASRAIYDEGDVVPLPAELRRRHLLKSRDHHTRAVRVARHVRSVVRFARKNLLCDGPPFAGQADVVFCRNVLIYFDHPTQLRVLSRLTAALRPGGYLFLGHSEMLHGFGLPFEICAPTVHRRL